MAQVGIVALLGTESGAAIVAALVAASVSALVGLLTYRATIRGHSAERQRLERELQRTMTGKLYDRRIEAYPKVWKITEALRASRLEANNAKSTPSYLRSVEKELDEWASGEAAMLLSDRSLEALYETRNALRVTPADGEIYSDAQIDRVWRAKGSLRQELRNDVGLIFTEEAVDG